MNLTRQLTDGLQGHIDTPLNDNGIKQSKATKELLKDVKIDICFTSDLQRAKKTAEIILEDHHTETPLIVDKRIKEKVAYHFKAEVVLYRLILHSLLLIIVPWTHGGPAIPRI